MAHVRWPAELKKARKLERGDRVMAVTPCWGGPSVFPHVFDAGIAYLEEQFGLQVVEAPHTRKPAEWLAKNPQARADDLVMAFEDSRIKGIFAAIGGNDSIRILPFLDLNVIAQNPKVFIGYSDVTAIHFACLKAGVSTFYGPSVMSGFAENCGMTEAGRNSFERAVFQAEQIGKIPKNTDGWTAEFLDWSDPKLLTRPRARTLDSGMVVLQGTGKHTGRLVGGCAEVLETLKATAWWPDVSYWDNAVLFFETSEEAPSAECVARWMRNYAAQGILERISGIILARPGGANISDAYREAQKEAVLVGLSECGLTELPVIADADIGHTDPILTLPMGAQVSIDCEAAQIDILEAGVTE